MGSAAFLAAATGPKQIAEQCDAHIKMELGILLHYSLEELCVPIYLVPSYQLGGVRFDFGILRWDGTLLALIQCGTNNAQSDTIADRFRLKTVRLRLTKDFWPEYDRCVDHILGMVGWS